MNTDLLTAIAQGEGFACVFPGGCAILYRRHLGTHAVYRVADKPWHLHYLRGVFLTDAPPSMDEPFGIQRYISPLCGLAWVTRITAVANGPFRVEFESTGPVFGDIRGN